MAKKLTRDEVTVREIDGEGLRSYIVTLSALGVTIRQKGERKSFGPLSLDGLYVRAGMQEANRIMREGKAVRPARVSRGLLSTERRNSLET